MKVCAVHFFAVRYLVLSRIKLASEPFISFLARIKFETGSVNIPAYCNPKQHSHPKQ